MRKINLLLLPFLLFGMAANVQAIGLNTTPRPEIKYKLPEGWKFGLRGKTRNYTLKKYIPRDQALYMWNELLEIKHWYREKSKDYDVKKRLDRELIKIKDQCNKFHFFYDPVSLTVPGYIAQYSCPKNLKHYRGEMGIMAFIMGKKGLYELHWRWKGPYYEPQGKSVEASKIPLPVGEEELKVWYNFFNKIKLEAAS